MLDSVRSPSTASNWRFAWFETLLVLLVFALHGGWPVPDVNEAHYLGSAKHYWNPEWCQGDFFLESAEAPVVFNALLGWLTLLFPLPVVAWIGRIVIWSLMAYAWRRLSWAVVPRRWGAVASAMLLVAINERCHMAGEWVVGGVESKGFAYALVWLGLEALVRDRWRLSLIYMGAATAFHVLVGGWSIVAVCFVWLLSPGRRPSVGAMFASGGMAMILALPGLWPAIELSRGVDSATAARAAEIYVYERLPHHLWPPGMKDGFVARFVALTALWTILCAATDGDEGQRRLRRFTAGAMAIWTAGMAITLLSHWAPELSTALLRFYWFRLADVILALGAALAAVRFFFDRLGAQRGVAWRWGALCAAIIAWHFGLLAQERFSDGNPRTESGRQLADGDAWREACEWIAQSDSIAADALFITPRTSHTFKWRAGRGEIGTRKDVPQGAAGLVEWERRMDDIFGSPDPSQGRFVDSLAERGADDLIRLAKKYGATHVLTLADPPLDLPRLYANDVYAVYELQRPR